MAHEEFSPEAIVVDHLHLMQTEEKGSNYYNKLTGISNSLKELAIELKLPVIVLAQLNRSSDKDEREPSDHDLRDSGAIEQDADRVVLLHRPHRSNEEWMAKDKEPALVIVKKNRNMGPAKIKCWFDKPTMEFIGRDQHDKHDDSCWETVSKKASIIIPKVKTDDKDNWGV